MGKGRAKAGFCIMLKYFEIEKAFSYYIKQMDSMLPCVCSVIDHRWRQNVIRTKKWHTRRSQVCHWCCYQQFDVLCDLLLNRHTAAWNLFGKQTRGNMEFICWIVSLHRWTLTRHERIWITFWTTSRFILNQLDYSLSISMRDSWLGLHPRQLSRDRNLELII